MTSPNNDGCFHSVVESMLACRYACQFRLCSVVPPLVDDVMPTSLTATNSLWGGRGKQSKSLFKYSFINLRGLKTKSHFLFKTLFTKAALCITIFSFSGDFFYFFHLAACACMCVPSYD